MEVKDPVRVERCGRLNAQPEHYMARSDPSDHLLMWSVSGRGWVQAGSVETQATAGTVAVLPAGRPHAYGSDADAPWDLLWVHFIGPAADAWVAGFESRYGLSADLGSEPALIERFTEFIASRHGHEADRRLAHHLLWGLMGRIDHRLALGRLTAGLGHADTLTALQRYVADHLNDAITVADLAAVAHLSPRQLTRLCRRAWGTSPMQYVIAQRLGRACSLLTETNLPVGRVAEASGFSDPYHFSHLFRVHMGESPRDHRRRHRRVQE